MSMSFQISLYDGATSSLIIRRVIPQNTSILNSSIVGLAKHGDVAGIKSLLERRQGSVYDVDEKEGYSALHYAINYGRVDAVKLLLAAGADPFIEDEAGYPAISMVHGVNFRKGPRDCPELEALLRGVLPWAEYLERYDFSHITRVILGDRRLDLMTEVRKPAYRQLLNRKDDLGRTPLHWAAGIGDHLAVQTLLLAGASVDEIDPGGVFPLSCACKAGSLACVDLLLAAGADLHQSGHLNTPIQVAAMCADVPTLDLLRSKGADLDDANNTFRTTPLARAAASNNVHAITYLLAHGVDINHRDWEGDTPLTEAIGQSAYAALSLLLEKGADYLEVNDEGFTVLHEAALNADAKTADILAATGLRGLDPEARDSKGRTALNILESRAGVTDDLWWSFVALLNSVRKANKKNEEDEMFDALEFYDFDS